MIMWFSNLGVTLSMPLTKLETIMYIVGYYGFSGIRVPTSNPISCVLITPSLIWEFFGIIQFFWQLHFLSLLQSEFHAYFILGSSGLEIIGTLLLHHRGIQRPLTFPNTISLPSLPWHSSIPWHSSNFELVF